MDISNLSEEQAVFICGLVKHTDLLDSLIYFTKTFANAHSYYECDAIDCDNCYGDSSERDNRGYRDSLCTTIWNTLSTSGGGDNDSAEEEVE